MSIFDGLPIDPPVQVAAPISIERPYTVTIKRASNGSEIMLCSVSPPPAGALTEAKLLDLALFTFDEIPAMKHCTAALDAIITTRRMMGWGGPITFTPEHA
jgi:hypothetical protein